MIPSHILSVLSPSDFGAFQSILSNTEFLLFVLSAAANACFGYIKVVEHDVAYINFLSMCLRLMTMMLLADKTSSERRSASVMMMMVQRFLSFMFRSNRLEMLSARATSATADECAARTSANAKCKAKCAEERQIKD